MCYADTVQESDGTHTADCYCGWVDGGHATAAAADRAADAHQNSQES